MSGKKECLLIALLSVTPLFAGGVTLPDPSTGAINGTIALRFWPAQSESLEPLPADHCDVHVVPEGSASETLYPCGSWFQPPVPGRYLVWLEQRATVSAQSYIIFDFLPFRGLGHSALMPMRPAGWLRMATEPARRDVTLRLLSLETSARDSRAFDRRLAIPQSDSAVRLPVGTAIGGLFDSAGRAISLSRPVKVVAGQTVAAKARVPDRGTDVLVLLVRRHHGRNAGPCHATATLNGGPERLADATLEAWDRVVAVWYSVEGESARIAIECADSRFEKVVTLSPKSVVTTRDELP